MNRYPHLNDIYISERLKAKLLEIADYRITTVIASAGCGKSTAVKKWNEYRARYITDSSAYRLTVQSGSITEFWRDFCGLMSYSLRTGCKRYVCSAAVCSACSFHTECISGKSKYRVAERVYHKLSMHIQHLNDNTPEFKAAMLKRKIFCEGNFSHQKARHNLSGMRMWGLRKL